MKRAKLEDFRYPQRIATSDARWPAVKAWQAQRLVRIVPETKDAATVELTDAGLQIANAERKSA